MALRSPCRSQATDDAPNQWPWESRLLLIFRRQEFENNTSASPLFFFCCFIPRCLRNRFKQLILFIYFFTIKVERPLRDGWRCQAGR